MQYCNWVLARMSEGSEDSSITIMRLGVVCSCIDRISTETLEHMCLQVGCCSAVFGVKVSMNGAVSFAFLSSTLEDVKLSALLVLNQDLGFEESINQ